VQDALGVAPAVDDIRSTCGRNNEEACCQNDQCFPHGNPPDSRDYCVTFEEFSQATTPTRYDEYPKNLIKDWPKCQFHPFLRIGASLAVPAE
jgi:hypothetical protein